MAASASAPALADGNTGKLVIKNKCNVSEGGLYVFAAIHGVTVWPKRGETDAREDRDHIGWAIICKTLVLGAPCRATRYDLGNLEAGGINQNTSIERDDFRVAAVENSGVVLKSSAVGQPTITVAMLQEVGSLAPWVSDMHPQGVLMAATRGVGRWHPQVPAAMLKWPEGLVVDNHWVVV